MIDTKELRDIAKQAAAGSGVIVSGTSEVGYERVKAVDVFLTEMIEITVPDEADRDVLKKSIEKFLALSCATAQVFVIEKIEKAQAVEAILKAKPAGTNVH